MRRFAVHGGVEVSEEPIQGATWSFAIALAAIGGFLAAVGVLLPWASATGVRTTEIFGEEVVGTTSSNGMGDPAGLVALAAGLIVGVLAVVALPTRGEGFRRLVGTIAIVGGVAVLVACALGATRPDDVLGALPLELTGARVAVESQVAAGLFISAAGGLIAAAGGLIARRTHVRT